MTQQAPAANKPPTVNDKALERAVEFQAFGSNETVSLSINVVRMWLAKPTAKGKVASDGDVMRFIMLCKARQLNPWEGDAFIIGYDGQNGAEFSLITAHQAFLKRGEAHAQYDGMESGVIVEQDGKIVDLPGDFFPTGAKLLGAWAKVYRKDQTHPKVARLNVETFDKKRAQWNSNRGGMIVKCAESDALRGAFPNTLSGMYNDAEMALTNAGASGVFVGNATAAAPELISEQQREDLVKLANDLGVVEKLGTLLKAAGFEMMAYITVDRYADIVESIRELGQPTTDGQTVDAEIIEESGHGDEAVEEPTTADDPDLDPETESIRAHVQELFDGLTKSQQKDLLVGKPSINASNLDELEALKDAIEGIAG